MTIGFLNTNLFNELKSQLFEIKQTLLDQSMALKWEIKNHDRLHSDEFDLSHEQTLENQMFIDQQRIRSTLFEVELALERMANGSYGICEELGEPIQIERLKLIPYTRFSIEGAELKEIENKHMHRRSNSA